MKRPENERPFIVYNVPLAPWTTLKLGGVARYFGSAFRENHVLRLVEWANDAGLHPKVLSGGSNIVIADTGVDSLVIHVALRGLTVEPCGPDHAWMHLAAGEPWSEAIRVASEQDLSGIECLAGIPGYAGSTPIQNVGAYGQEIAHVLHRVRAFDRQGGDFVELDPRACGFGYRDSVFKRNPDRWIITNITLRLSRGAPSAPSYAELARAVHGDNALTVDSIRRAVLDLRRRKSMVVEPLNPNSRSVGSFFTNPVVSETQLETIARAANASPPRFPHLERYKVAAAWLIERAGFQRGHRYRAVGVSSDHALALVHHGQGQTRDLLELAAQIRGRVFERFGVTLEPEPQLWGTSWPWAPEG